MLPDDERWRVLDRELARLLALPLDARAPWLEDCAVRDPALAAELRRLLAALDASEPLDRLNTSPLYAEALAELPGIGPGDALGGWQLLQRIGTGGMSEVYLAEREHNGVRQRAALKLMAAGMAAATLRSGFIHECRILAALSDARIARYYDSGIADDGRPWLAMEHVEGLALDLFLQANALALQRRLDLFLEIAGAVGHAHDRLIVHRDLKPSNVMVTPAGQVKLLDFGIAKALRDAFDQAVTAVSTRVLTLEYASPEQLNGDLVNVASDVYQLGLLLYLLVAGRYPHADTGGNRARTMQAILQDTPQPPSRVLRHGGAGRSEVSAVAGDLDAIVLKALAKAPDARYATVDALCADLQAWRENRPVQARRAGAWKRSAKFIRRHRIAAAITATTLLAGSVFGIAWVDQAMRAAREAETSRAVLELLGGALHANRYGVDPQPVETVTALLDEVERQALLTLPERPEALLQTLLLIGQARLGRGEYRDAVEVLQRARAVPALARMPETLRDDIDTTLIDALHFTGDYDGARRLATLHLARLERRHGTDDPRLFSVLAASTDLTHSLGDYPGALALAQRLLSLSHAHFGETDTRTAVAHRLLGMVLRDRDEFGSAEKSLQASVRIDRARLGKHVNLATGLDHLGQIHLQRGDLPAAQETLDEADAIRTALFQPGLLGRAWAGHRLAQLQLLRGEIPAAISRLRRIVETYARELGEGSHITALARSDLAWALLADGRHSAAASELSRAEAVFASHAGGRHPRRGEILLGQAVIALADGDLGSAGDLAQRALDLRLGVLDEGHPALAACCRVLRIAGRDCAMTPPGSDHALAWGQLELALAPL
ncbi:serine/threonine-protein kinase [Luteimonas suaedae]|uniref:serine/threonine-protein kinase n=1 Tax=Luteimonas suaedae TaxID=2605430 RepID=UPI0011EE6F4E|nr:serine/threonine-protein kinase [Luteimonas suaedae]